MPRRRAPVQPGRDHLPPARRHHSHRARLERRQVVYSSYKDGPAGAWSAPQPIIDGDSHPRRHPRLRGRLRRNMRLSPFTSRGSPGCICSGPCTPPAASAMSIPRTAGRTGRAKMPWPITPSCIPPPRRRLCRPRVRHGPRADPAVGQRPAAGVRALSVLRPLAARGGLLSGLCLRAARRRRHGVDRARRTARHEPLRLFRPTLTSQAAHLRSSEPGNAGSGPVWLIWRENTGSPRAVPRAGLARDAVEWDGAAMRHPLLSAPGIAARPCGRRRRAVLAARSVVALTAPTLACGFAPDACQPLRRGRPRMPSGTARPPRPCPRPARNRPRAWPRPPRPAARAARRGRASRSARDPAPTATPLPSPTPYGRWLSPGDQGSAPVLRRAGRADRPAQADPAGLYPHAPATRHAGQHRPRRSCSTPAMKAPRR